jgi:peptidoglycan hydrolase-like protein with peptidoglycan-binding domain
MSSSSVVAVATREHAVVVSTLPHFTQNLELHDVGGNVRLLQEYLNDHGYLIAKTGPGSPGHETNTFGRHTLIALKEFQKANNIKVDGYFGWTTRQIVNEGLGVTNLQ